MTTWRAALGTPAGLFVRIGLGHYVRLFASHLSAAAVGFAVAVGWAARNLAT